MASIDATNVAEPATVVAGDDAMAQLAEAVDPYDARDFRRIYRAMDWDARSADDFAEAVRLALQGGLVMEARHLAMEGAARYPNHPELEKQAYLLAPPRVVSLGPPEPRIEKDRQWLKKHWDDYRGKWVALYDGELLAVAETHDELIDEVGNTKNTGILITALW